MRVVPGPARGTIRAPSSKSYTHRELVASFFATGPTVLLRPLEAEDTWATREGLERMGARIRSGPARWLVRPPGHGPPRGRRRITIDCHRSGTTLRFLAAAAAVRPGRYTFTGSNELARRPMAPLWDFLRSAGAKVRPPRSGRAIPTTIEGPISAPDGRIDASESSQYVSALLLALPALEGRSRIRTTGPEVSAPYIASTIDVLARRGLDWARSGRSYLIQGPKQPAGGRVRLPGDASSSAYLWAAAGISGGSVRVDGVPLTRPQADLAILRILRRMGAEVELGSRGVRVTGRPLRGLTVDLTGSPDLLPLVGILAASGTGRTMLRGAAHARLKESDRWKATAALVRALGGRARPGPGGLCIDPGPGARAAVFPRADDHRVIMSGAVAALRAGPSVIDDAGAVEKSFPGFWEALRKVRVGTAEVPT